MLEEISGIYQEHIDPTYIILPPEDIDWDKDIQNHVIGSIPLICGPFKSQLRCFPSLTKVRVSPKPFVKGF